MFAQLLVEHVVPPAPIVTRAGGYTLSIEWFFPVIGVAAGGGLVVWLLWLLTRGSTRFVIEIREDDVVVVQGEPPDWFIKDVRRIAAFSGLASGTIRAVRHGSRVRLQFSRDIAEGNQWQFRNAWRNPMD
jgi:hypothetical protein